MTADEARTKLAELDAAYADAKERLQSLGGRPAERGFVNGARAADLLTAYLRDVGNRSRKPDDAEHAALSRDVAEAILANGLVLEAAGAGRPGNLFRIYDPEPARRYADAQRAAAEAATERDRFAVDVADVLVEADKRDRMAAIRDALDADDPDRLADALAGLPPRTTSQPSALTTDDLPVTT